MPAKPAPAALPWIAAALVGGTLLAFGATIATFLATRAPAPPRPAPKADARPAPPPAKQAATAPADPNAYPIKRALTIDKQMTHGDWLWDDRGVPAGPLLVTVDLKAQMISVFRDGYEIGVAVIEHGANDKPTPLGVFPILAKDADHVSSSYVDANDRPAPMPWMLRLTPDGVAIHGAEIRPDWASNGCVGIPNEFAKRLFAEAKVGDRVIITSGAVMTVGNRVSTL